jgi:hypothetical protein
LGGSADSESVALPAIALIALACALLPGAAAASGTGGTSPGRNGGTLPVTRPGVLPGGKPDAPARPRRPRPRPNGPAVADVPRAYLRLYRSADRIYGVSWRLLAAMGKNESDHGRATLPGVSEGLNFARCCAGPMQICTVSACGNPWGSYAVDGNRDGQASPYQPADAIYTAAAMVRDLQRTFGRNPRLLLAAYNAGAGAVQRYKGVPPYSETQAYVNYGLLYIRQLRA